MLSFYEFFAGGGMARLGLGSKWECLFANDFDPKKTSSYRRNFDGAPELVEGDVAEISPQALRSNADLVWASFPCQDLSLAGNGAGLSGIRSGAFWPFWNLIHQVIRDGRKPKIIALENVCGTLSSNEGKDFSAISEQFRKAGYRFGAAVIDAEKFLPQSRPRLFMIGISDDLCIPQKLISKRPVSWIHPKNLLAAYEQLTQSDKENWIWWNLRMPTLRAVNFSDLIETDPVDVQWCSLKEAKSLLALMSPLNLAKVQAAQLKRKRMVGTIYRRTRFDENQTKVQRAEVRFDGIAGCLRTPIGGSSRQRILVVEGNSIRTRLLSSREAARLMGLKESYILPNRYNDAYHLIGDGVAIPVVRHLAQHIFEPLIASNRFDAPAIAAE